VLECHGPPTTVEEWKLNKAITPSAQAQSPAADVACAAHVRAWLAYAPAIRLNSSARRPDEVHPDRAHLRQADLAHHLEQAIRVGLQELREFRPVEIGDLASGLLEARDHDLVLHEGADRVAQNARHVRGRLRRRKYAGPEDIDHVRISSLLQRRRV